MRASLIVNPRSGADRAPAMLPRIAERLRTMVSALDITVTTGEEDVIRAAERAVRDGAAVLFVAGGDGTLNAAVRGVAALPGALGRIAVGVIPAGTGNDFAKALGLGEDPDQAIEFLLRMSVIQVDVGTVNDRAFLNVSAGGFVADVSAILTEQLKDVTGKLAYVIGGARALFGTEPFSASVVVAARDDAVSEKKATRLPVTAEPIELQMFAVCNARLIGGGYPIAPAAIIDDGLLDVYVVRRVPVLEFVALLKGIAAGEHEGDARIIHFRARELELLFDRNVRVNIDGEVFEASRCHYRILPRAARFLCGPRPHAASTPEPLSKQRPIA